MNKTFLKDAVGWGGGLWFIGWVLGIIAFMVVPPNMIGWVVSPIGILITLWVLIKRVKGENMAYYFCDMITMGDIMDSKILNIKNIKYLKVDIEGGEFKMFDYLFNVLLFNIGTEYYKLDIYIYYATTFILPLVVGYFKTKK